MNSIGRDHSFSIEMKSKNYVKTISMSNEAYGGVLFEGLLGKLERIDMIDDILLEIKGTNGTLRIDLSKEELEKILPEKGGKKV